MRRFAGYMGWDATRAGERRLPATSSRPADDGLQRRHRRRGRGEPAAGRASCRRGPAADGWNRCCGRRPGPRRSRRRCGRRWPATAAATMILATRYGFHGKKGLANAVTGCETDRDRDPRVRFISFPMAECADVTLRGTAVRPRPVPPRTGRPVRRVRPAARHAHHRAVPRRRRLVPPAEGVPAAAAELLPGARPRLHPRRGAGELRPHRRPVRLRDLRPGAGRRRARQGAGQRRPGGGGGRPGRPVRRPRLRRRVRHLERQPALLRRRAGHARRVRRPATCSATAGEASARDRGGAGAAEGAAVRGPRPRREGRHGLGRRDARPRRPDARPSGPTPCVLACYRGDGADGDGIHLLGPLAKKVVRIAPPLVITAAEVRAEHGVDVTLASSLVPGPGPRSFGPRPVANSSEGASLCDTSLPCSASPWSCSARPRAAEPFRYPVGKLGDAELSYVNNVPVLTVAGTPARWARPSASWR